MSHVVSFSDTLSLGETEPHQLIPGSYLVVTMLEGGTEAYSIRRTLPILLGGALYVVLCPADYYSPSNGSFTKAFQLVDAAKLSTTGRALTVNWHSAKRSLADKNSEPISNIQKIASLGRVLNNSSALSLFSSGKGQESQAGVVSTLYPIVAARDNYVNKKKEPWISVRM